MPMSGYLLAGCVIENLIQDQVIAPVHEAWQENVPENFFYYVYLRHAATGILMAFDVFVLHQRHVISSTAFQNQAKFFGIDPSNILEQCRVPS